jgi:hypothetical protein
MNETARSPTPPVDSEHHSSEHLARRGGSRSRHAAGMSPFAPLLILLLGMNAWSGFQLHHLLLESDSLAAARAGQEGALQQAQRVRQALEAVANETRKLADAGNPNAKTVVEELRKRGVTINPPVAAAPAIK